MHSVVVLFVCSCVVWCVAVVGACLGWFANDWVLLCIYDVEFMGL